MKRFTETNKWRDPWYRKLTSPAKQLWEYLRDNCDAIGLVEIDFRLVSGDCGQKITESHMRELGDRVQWIENSRFFLTKFISFQYGELSETCPAHRHVLRLIVIHKLIRVGLHYRYPSDTLSSQDVGCQQNEYPNARVAIPYKTGLDKDKDKDSTKGESEGDEPEPPNDVQRPRIAKPTIESVKLQASKSGLSMDEAEKFFNYYESKGWFVGKSPMKSWPHAMANWKKNVEQRIYEQGPINNKPKPLSYVDRQLKTI